MKTLIVYENLSSGGIISVIRNRIMSGRYTEAVLYCQNDQGGSSAFKNIDDIQIIVGQIGHDLNIKEIIQVHEIEHIVLFSHYHLLRDFTKLNIEVTVEYHKSDEKSLHTIKKFVPENIDIIVPSEWSKRFIRSVWDGNIIVVPNEVDTKIFHHDENVEKPKIPEYIYVGQVGYHKGLEFCLRGFKLFCDSLGEHCLNVIISQKPKDADIIDFFRMVDDYGLSKYVQPYWSISQNELAGLYRRCGASNGRNIVASLRESFGLSVVEARACGLKSVVPNVAALPEIMADDDISYQFGDANDLCQALKSSLG